MLRMILYLLFSWLLLIALKTSFVILKKKRSYWEERIREMESARKTAHEEFGKLEAVKTETKNKESTIVTIYEITRRMSASLKMEEIVGIFNSFLKDNFIFGKSVLIILKETDGVPTMARRFDMCSTGRPTEELCVDCDEALRLLAGSGKEVYLKRDQSPDIFKRLAVEERTNTVALIPLLSEKKNVGILVIEDIPFVYFERVVILAMQFSLELKKVLLYERVEELAITDGLTGLYVRRYFFERLNEELHRSRRHKFKFAFLMIDIDNFKNYNDMYGHLVGDVVLKDVAQMIREGVREIDLVSRYGGEEFAVVLPETETESARAAAERIRETIAKNTFKAYDENLNITISIGIAEYPDDSKSVDELVENADSALYRAKAAGKNIVSIYGK